MRAVMVDLRARLELSRRWWPSAMQNPTSQPWPMLEYRLTIAFFAAVPIALLWAAFSTGVVWTWIAGATVVLGLCTLVFGGPQQWRKRKWRREADWALFALLDVDPLAFDPRNDKRRICHGVLTFDPWLEERPRELVAVAHRLRAALADPEGCRDPELRAFVAEIAPRIDRRLAYSHDHRVPRTLTNGRDARFVELKLSPNLFPEARLASELFFVLAHREYASPDMLAHVQAEGFWGPGALAITRAFPVEPGASV